MKNFFSSCLILILMLSSSLVYSLPTEKQIKVAEKIVKRSDQRLKRLTSVSRKTYKKYQILHNAIRRENKPKLKALYRSIKKDEHTLTNTYCKQETVTDQDCQEKKAALHKQHSLEIAAIANDIATRTQEALERLLEELMVVETSAKAVEIELRTDLEEMSHVLTRDAQHASYYVEHLQFVKQRLELCQGVQHDLFDDIDLIQKTLVGSLCFALLNGPQTVEGDQEQAFEKAVADATEDILAEDDIMVDVIDSEIIDQVYFAQEQQQQQQQGIINNNNDNRRGLIQELISAIQVQIMLTFRCKCKDIDPVSDVYSDRRTLSLQSEDMEQRAKTKYQQASAFLARKLQSNSDDASSSSSAENFETLLQEDVSLIFGDNVTVVVMPCTNLNLRFEGAGSLTFNGGS